MALIEQLVCGLNPESPDAGRGLLSHSPGMGAKVTEEVLRYCAGWGTEPPEGLLRPAVISLPLRATMPSIRGQLFAVIRVSTGYPACFHAIVMSKVDFRSFGYNPFAVVKGGTFLDVWSRGERLARGNIQPPDPDSVFSPPASPADVGLVDELLQEFMYRGKLSLNLEAPTAESDRALGLAIRLMPLGHKEKLSFASFTRAGDNVYQLAASYASNTPFASWKRLFMTLVEQAIPEDVRLYVARARNALIAGDLSEMDQCQWNPGAKNEKNSQQPAPALEPLSGASLPLESEAKGGDKPALSTRSFDKAPKIAPAMVTSFPTGQGPGSERVSRYGQTSVSGPGHRRNKRSPLVRQSVPMSRRPGRKKPRSWGWAAVMVLALAAGWFYLDWSGKVEQWGLPDIAAWRPTHQSENKAPSLLEVVDVGDEYARVLNKIQRSRIVPGADRDQARHRAQADLQAKVAGPLLVQADLFLELSDAGIQQGNRPDREGDRLEALDKQGRVLVEELGLLELAYYSLGEGPLWNDLEKLSAGKVKARRDSLSRHAKVSFAESNKEIGTAAYWRSLQTARTNVSGMASLMSLFQEKSWSKNWEKQLQKAATRVAPTASPTSRAYRNSAFTLLRLKKAERLEANQEAAYGESFDQENWPSPLVSEVLADVRRKASLFGPDEIPELLKGIMELYARLGNPKKIITEICSSEKPLQNIRENSAYRFDPGAYSEVLARIRFEAASALLAEGKAPEEIPGYLLSEIGRDNLLQFREILTHRDSAEEWEQLASMAGDSFVGRWSQRQVREVQNRLQILRENHDRAWAASSELRDEMRHRAQAGKDWTSVWVDLVAELDVVLGASPVAISRDSLRSRQWHQAAEMKAMLQESSPLKVISVVVRLEQDVLTAPTEVEVELETEPGGQVVRTQKISMGPAAPEGTGWVGTVYLDWDLRVSPQDRFMARVLATGRSTPLLGVEYPPLSERVGPGALERPRRAEGGSLTFKTDGQWWRKTLVAGGAIN